jgi:hypothetical protein
MAFIKNDGYIVQRKIPSEFQELLAVSDQQGILGNFSEEERLNMRNFLTNATGTDWHDDGRKFGMTERGTTFPVVARNYSTCSTAATTIEDRQIDGFQIICKSLGGAPFFSI